MSVQASVLIHPVYAPASDTTVYTSPADTTTIIDKFTATNTDSSARTLSVNIVPSGGTLDAENLIIKDVSIGIGETMDFTTLQNHILGDGDQISVIASDASKVVIRSSGRKIT